MRAQDATKLPGRWFGPEEKPTRAGLYPVKFGGNKTVCWCLWGDKPGFAGWSFAWVYTGDECSYRRCGRGDQAKSWYGFEE